MPRRLETELLDILPADDPAALRSRRDLRRVNQLMFSSSLMARRIKAFFPPEAPPRRLLDVGAGDGTLALTLARKLSRHWPGVNVTLLDRQNLISESTRLAFAEMGWEASSAIADVFTGLGSGHRYDIVISNLFLHHFESDDLTRLLSHIADVAPFFIALEPRRARFPLVMSELLWAIGCNHVTRHDAVASVRAGFSGSEITDSGHGRRNGASLRKRRGPSVIVSLRIMSEPLYDVLILGAGPAGATAALLLARAGWNVAIVEKSAFPRRKVCGEFLSVTTMPVLETLGIANAFITRAGPPVRRVALFETNMDIAARMPKADGANGAGRALGRDHLDSLLLDQAIAAGATCWQPWRAVSLERTDAGWLCVIESAQGKRALAGKRVIAATGAWERSPGFDPTMIPHRDSDLLGFKAHFTASTLPDDTMPLLVFPGGYGGMVHSDTGRVSLSCCVRRDALARLREKYPGRAGDAVVAHIAQSCQAAGRALERAELHETILSAGPIRPGFRACYKDGIFAIGNSAGEAHPIIAEGIGMAMQSAWLLCRHLLANDPASPPEAIGKAYQRDWRRHFALRIRAASAFARLALRPSTHGAIRALLRHEPASFDPRRAAQRQDPPIEW